jgi:hypothetical protein
VPETRPLCSIGTCGRERIDPRRTASSPYCSAHYDRNRIYGDPLLGPPIRDHRPDRAEYVIGEVEWFKSFGVSPELIAGDLGVKVGSLVISLRRWGRADLAEYFIPEPEENWAKRYLQTKKPAA